MLDEIKIALKSHFCCKKRYNFVIMYAALLWTSLRFPKICKPLVHGIISLADATSYDKLVFINTAKVMFKVSQGISPIYITEMLQIKSCNSQNTMTWRSDSNKYFKHQCPYQKCLKTAYLIQVL